MYTIGGLLQKLKVNYFPTDKTTQIQRQVLEKWPNQSGVPEFILHDGVQHQGVCSETPSERGDEYHMHLGLHADSQSSKQQHFTSLAVLEKGPKKAPHKSILGKLQPHMLEILVGGFFWGPEKPLFSLFLARKPKMTKVMGKANARHKFLSTSFNPGRGQHFTVRKLYRHKKAPRRPSCPCSVDGHTV